MNENHVKLVNLERLISHANTCDGPMIKSMLEISLTYFESVEMDDILSVIILKYLKAVRQLLIAGKYDILPCCRDRKYGSGVITAYGWKGAEIDIQSITFRMFYDYIVETFEEKIGCGLEPAIKFGDVSINMDSDTSVNIYKYNAGKKCTAMNISFSGIKLETGGYDIISVKISKIIDKYVDYENGTEIEIDKPIAEMLTTCLNIHKSFGFDNDTLLAVIDITRLNMIE